MRYAGNEYQGAVYADQSNKVLEAHLLDFSGDLYGKELELELLGKIRDARAFSSEDEAKRTIAADVQAVRDFFNSEELRA